MTLTFICCVNNQDIFSENIGRSNAWINNPHIIKHTTNVGRAYDDAISKVHSDLIIFVHQDVYLPDNWMVDLRNSLIKLKGKKWGVLGVAGTSYEGKQVYKGHLKSRGVEWNKTPVNELPVEVQTLDELLLIIKNDGKLHFDRNLPSCDFYGVDICLEALELGLKNYVIDVYLHHNSRRAKRAPLPLGFFKTREYMKKKWSHMSPVATTCTVF